MSVPRLNRREAWLVGPVLTYLHGRWMRDGASKTDRQLAAEWWLWRLAGTTMPWHRGR